MILLTKFALVCACIGANEWKIPYNKFEPHALAYSALSSVRISVSESVATESFRNVCMCQQSKQSGATSDDLMWPISANISILCMENKISKFSTCVTRKSINSEMWEKILWINSLEKFYGEFVFFFFLKNSVENFFWKNLWKNSLEKFFGKISRKKFCVYASEQIDSVVYEERKDWNLWRMEMPFRRPSPV